MGIAKILRAAQFVSIGLVALAAALMFRPTTSPPRPVEEETLTRLRGSESSAQVVGSLSCDAWTLVAIKTKLPPGFPYDPNSKTGPVAAGDICGQASVGSRCIDCQLPNGQAGPLPVNQILVTGSNTGGNGYNPKGNGSPCGVLTAGNCTWNDAGFFECPSADGNNYGGCAAGVMFGRQVVPMPINQ